STVNRAVAVVPGAPGASEAFIDVPPADTMRAFVSFWYRNADIGFDLHHACIVKAATAKSARSRRPAARSTPARPRARRADGERTSADGVADGGPSARAPLHIDIRPVHKADLDQIVALD